LSLFLHAKLYFCNKIESLRGYTAIFILVLFLLHSGCKKKSDPVFGPYTMQSIFVNTAVTPTIYTMDAGLGGAILSASGTRYNFPPNALQKDSQRVYGDVQVEMAEYLTKSDMIFSGILPYSNGQPFLSAGAFYLNISQNGLPVYISKSTKYLVTIPQKTLPPMGLQLYLGRPDDTLQSNSVNWQLNTDTSIGSVIWGDSLVVASDSVHFCNAGLPLDSLNYQSFSVKISAPITTFSDTLVAYAIYDTMNVVWQMGQSHNHIISENMVPNLPVHFVAFTVIDGYFYGGMLAARPQNGQTYTINLSLTSPAALKHKIDGL